MKKEWKCGGEETEEGETLEVTLHRREGTTEQDRSKHSRFPLFAMHTRLLNIRVISHDCHDIPPLLPLTQQQQPTPKSHQPK
jgi:hypothetical protein